MVEESSHPVEKDLKEKNYALVVNALFSRPHIFYSFPTSPHPLLFAQDGSKDRKVPTISSLSLHPALESTLHLLNGDLPSAHFLLRHAQAGPAYEMMFLHGVLHRIEGDVDNARAWYGNVVGTEVFGFVWTDNNNWKGFLDRIERVRDSVRKRDGSGVRNEIDWDGEMEELQKTSLWEIKKILEFCERKFGTGAVVDASPVWVQPDKKHSELRDQMIVGGEGWREF